MPHQEWFKSAELGTGSHVESGRSLMIIMLNAFAAAMSLPTLYVGLMARALFRSRRVMEDWWWVMVGGWVWCLMFDGWRGVGGCLRGEFGAIYFGRQRMQTTFNLSFNFILEQLIWNSTQWLCHRRPMKPRLLTAIEFNAMIVAVFLNCRPLHRHTTVRRVH